MWLCGEIPREKRHLADLTGGRLSGGLSLLSKIKRDIRGFTQTWCVPPSARQGKWEAWGERGGKGARSGLGDKVEGQGRPRDRELAGGLRQGQVPAESGRRCGRQARRGEAGAASASGSRARRPARPGQPGAPASPPPATAAAERQHPPERRPGLRRRLPPAGGERRRPLRPSTCRGPLGGRRGEQEQPLVSTPRGEGAPASAASPRAPRVQRRHPFKGLLRAVRTAAPATPAGPRDSRRPSAPRARPTPRRPTARPGRPCPGCAGAAC